MYSKLLSEVLVGPEFKQYQVPDIGHYHSFLEYGAYYVIPHSLMELVTHEVGRDRFVEDDIKRESEIAKAAGDGYGNVAIKDAEFIVYPDLEEFVPVSLNADAAKVLKMNAAKARQFVQTANSRLKFVNSIRRGYLGWLLTNRQFLDEHDAILTRFSTQTGQRGFPHPAILVEGGPGQPVQNGSDWVQEFKSFYARWRLQSLNLPYLPSPQSFEVPSVRAAQINPEDVGTVEAKIPDIYPTQGRGFLDSTIEDALRGKKTSDHLSEWFKIIGVENMGKKVIQVFDRWFRLQHYWRIFHRRYPVALHRRKTQLVNAFASFHNVSVDAIKSDLRRISKRLGSDWENRFVRHS